MLLINRQIIVKDTVRIEIANLTNIFTNTK